MLEFVHLDVCKPMSTPSFEGTRYFVIFIDGFLRKVWIYILKAKSESFSKFREQKTFVEKQCEQKIKVLRLDNGGEYFSKNFDDLLKYESMTRQTFTTNTLQYNEVVERKNCTTMEMTKKMLYFKNLGYEYWIEAMINMMYTRNRCSTSVLKRMNFEEAQTGNKIYIFYMRIFMYIAYVKIVDSIRGKLKRISIRFLFLNYYKGTKAHGPMY